MEDKRPHIITSPPKGKGITSEVDMPIYKRNKESIRKTPKYAGELEYKESTKTYHVYEGQMAILYIKRKIMPEAPRKVIVTVEGKNV